MKHESEETFRSETTNGSVSDTVDSDEGSDGSTAATEAGSPQNPAKQAPHREENVMDNAVVQKGESIAEKHRRLFRKNPQHLILALFLFALLTTSGITLAAVFGRSILEQKQQEALSLAYKTGSFFSKNLDQAILPLFSMAQFANELKEFKGLPFWVGSLPFMPTKIEQGVPTHRDVAGVCDDPLLVKKFEQVAGDIKKSARMGGILVNLQLVPDAVVCLVHPFNNTEDFPPGVFMDNSGAIGHDVLIDPARKFITRETVMAEDVVIAGPLSLKQCEDCDPVVEKGFIVRLPIASDTNIIKVDDVGYKRWGFAVAIINWDELVRRSNVYEMFESEALEFQLTRTDRTYNPENSEFIEDVSLMTQAAVRKILGKCL